ncbi:OadG family protein [Clostridium sp. CS001]|uniref:OadG family protein n=1 Tax=Clostridium sp. CS001 TaxID=2880648 RepID=UPI001CF134EA|nr:OadG family protein [Clostridium sp. CS001]MCB2291000.1 OadG family protein [Clostridium sp. CS001]
MKYSFLDALGTTFVAMIIVFSLLILLMYIIKFQSFILNLPGKKAQINKVDIVEEEKEEGKQYQDDLEIVAAIAAALSSYLDVPQSNLNIKSIKRVSSKWGH